MTIGTRKPPIEMRHHFFPSVHIEADANVVEKKHKNSDFGYDFKVDLQVGELLPEGLYPIVLVLESCAMEGKLQGYSLKIMAVGYIALDPSVPEERKRNLVAVNGGSLLYSATREFIYSVTLRGPFPAIYLPTVSFVPKDEAAQVPPPPASKPKKARKTKQLKA